MRSGNSIAGCACVHGKRSGLACARLVLALAKALLADGR